MIQLPKTYNFSAKPIEDINNAQITYLRQIPSEITTKTPVSFKIIIQRYWAIRGKGDIEIEIEKVINKRELLWLANLIKESLFYNAEMVIMLHYVKNKNQDMAWATTHYKDGEIELNINGFLE
jgi:hypothetical protein